MKADFFNNTMGLVLCGGRSSRMQFDKSLLQYYGKPQRYHLYEMLQPFCQETFISCNKTQAQMMYAGYQFLTDLPEYENIGPMAGLLTAFEQFTDKNILVIGCDYPFLHQDEVSLFCHTIINKGRPVAFYKEEAEKYEPMLAWYPANIFEDLRSRYRNGERSLQQFLITKDADKYIPANGAIMKSIDTPDAYYATRQLLITIKQSFFC